MSRLLVLGNAGLDIGLRLPRVPKPGETLVGGAGGRAPGGKGLNQATVAARTKLAPVLFRAPIGDDVEGREVARLAAAEPFAGLELPILAAPTDSSILMVLPDGENSICSAGDCAFGLAPEDAAAFAARCEPGDWLLLQGNLLPQVTAAATAAARARGGRVAFNAAPVSDGTAALLPGLDLIIANAGEAHALIGDGGVPALHAATGGIAIVTLGAQGCEVADGETVRHHPAPAVDVVDTTGAGDAFCGVLLAAMAAGWPLGCAVGAAQRAAALTVTRPGAFAALPVSIELRALLATA